MGGGEFTDKNGTKRKKRIEETWVVINVWTGWKWEGTEGTSKGQRELGRNRGN